MQINQILFFPMVFIVPTIASTCCLFHFISYQRWRLYSNLKANNNVTHCRTRSKKPLLAGFATVDITPPLDLKVRLGGYLRFYKFAQKVLHPLKARALCIRNPQNNKDSVIIISNDLVGFQYRLARLVRKQISKDTGVPFANIMLHFTHSHSSPDGTGIFPNELSHFPRTDVQYPVMLYMMKKMVKAGKEAFKDAQTPIKIGFGETAKLDRPISVRREPPYNVIDIPIRFLKITSMKDELLGVIVNYQGHPTQLPQVNSDISTEYPGQVAESLHKQIPSLKYASYFNGAIGDVSITGYKGYFHYKIEKMMKDTGKTWKELVVDERKKIRRELHKKGNMHEEAMKYALNQIETLGKDIATYVINALDSTPCEPLTILKSRRRYLFAKVGRIKSIRSRIKWYKGIKSKLFLLWYEFKQRLRIAALFYGYYLMNGRFLPMLNVKINNKQLLHQTEIQVFRFNDFYWFAAPGEPFLEYQEYLFKRTPNHKAFFSNMANDTCGYIFPWSFYARGGYETTFSYDMQLGKEMVLMFENELKELKK